MKKLHAIKSDPLREFTQYAQIKKGFVTVTNGLCLLRLPASEVFGENIILDTDELYLKLETWKLLKFGIVKSITRDGLQFKNQFGVLTATTVIPNGRYPDTDAVIPDRNKETSLIDNFGLNPIVYNYAFEAFGVSADKVRLWFYGVNKLCVLESEESKGFVLLMPLLHDWANRYPMAPVSDFI